MVKMQLSIHMKHNKMLLQKCLRRNARHSLHWFKNTSCFYKMKSVKNNHALSKYESSVYKKEKYNA